jgi:cardiolipin synthase
MFEIIKKEKLVSFEDEILPPCWIRKDLKQANKENNYFKDTKISKNIRVSGNDEKLLNELKVSIDNAKEMICITSYIFNEPDIKKCLLNASKRGVRVYMLTASNKHLKNQPDEDDDFNKKMYIEMDKLFKELQGKIKIRTSENFHTKFLLIDPLNSELRQGYLLTSNFDTKGIKGRKINDLSE